MFTVNADLVKEIVVVLHVIHGQQLDKEEQ